MYYNSLFCFLFLFIDTKRPPGFFTLRSQIKAILQINSIPIPTPIMITQSPLLEFMRQDGLIDRFKQTGSKVTMERNGHIDDDCPSFIFGHPPRLRVSAGDKSFPGPLGLRFIRGEAKPSGASAWLGGVVIIDPDAEAETPHHRGIS